MKCLLKKIIGYYLILVLTGCEKNTSPDLTGDISGKVIVEDENQNIIQDKSGVKVEIINNDSVLSTFTNQEGEFSFNNINFGKYKTKLTKTGFVGFYPKNNSNLDSSEFNITDANSHATLKLYLFEIPKFEIHLDSAKYLPESELRACIAFGSRPYESITPVYEYYLLVCFFNDNPEVSKNDFKFCKYGAVFFNKRWPDWEPPLIEMDYSGDLSNIEADSIFICIYPVSRGENENYPIRNESLGKPSNVIGFPIK